MFSQRSHRDTEAHPLAVLKDALTLAGKAPLDLTESNPTAANVPYERERILDAMRDERALVYEPAPFGIRSAREAVAAWYGAQNRAVDPDRVILTASTSEAYAQLFRLLCDPGDDVLVPQPSYPLFEELARGEGIILRPYPLRYDGSWHLSESDLLRARTPRTRASLVVHPNNPTGSYLKKNEAEALATLDIPCIYDTVFETYGLTTPNEVADPLLDGPTLRFVLAGMSKLAALPQMKLGWVIVAGDDDLARTALERLEIAFDASLSVGAPVQHALGELLAGSRSTHAAIHARTKTNLAVAHEQLRATAATPLFVEGGWYVVVRMPATRSEEAWALSLLEREGVYVHPGEFFGFSEGAYLVVSLLTEEPTFSEGLTRLARHVREAAEHA